MQGEKQVRTNFYTNIVTLLVNLAVGIYYTPYLISKLGVVAYGILPLALIINQYISVITGSLTSSFSIFYSIAVQREEYNKASETISTSLLVIVLLIVILSPVLILVIHRADTIFNVPSVLVKNIKQVFVYSILSFFVSLITSLLNVSLFSLNRLDLMNILKIVRSALKLVFVLLFFSLVDVNVIYVGLSSLLTELFILVISVFLFIKFTNSQVAINLIKWNKTILYAVGEMTIWIIIHQIGDTGIYRIDNFIVNKFWGISESGALGAITEFGSYMVVLVSVVGGLFGPLILIAFSTHDHERVQQMAFSQSYLVGSLAAVIAGVVAGYASIILRVWLGDSFALFGHWLVIKMVSIPYYAAGGVLALIYRTWNRVKVPALVTLFLGVTNFIILFLMASSKNNSIIHVLIVSAVISVIQSYYFNGYYVSRIYKGSFLPTMVSSIKIGIIFAISFSICRLCEHYFNIQNMITLVFMLVVSAFVLFSFVFLLFYNRDTKKQFLRLFFK
jgi:membrane protein EpsK